MNSLKELFKANEANLRSDLTRIANGKEKDIVAVLKNMFSTYNNIDDYKKDLSIEEANMFMSAMQLVQVSMGIAETLFVPVSQFSNITSQKNASTNDKTHSRCFISKAQLGLVGTAATGVLVGACPNLITIPIMIVVGAISFMLPNKEVVKTEYKTAPAEYKKIDIDGIIEKIYAIAEQIDNLMSTYTTNVNKIKSTLIQQPTNNTLAKNYSYLVERLRDLYSVNSKDDQESALKLLRKTLANYGCELIEYSEDNKAFFDIRESEYVSRLHVESLAFVEKENCILRGTVFIPLQTK